MSLAHDRDIDRACNLLALSAVLASKDWCVDRQVNSLTFNAIT